VQELAEPGSETGSETGSQTETQTEPSERRLGLASAVLRIQSALELPIETPLHQIIVRAAQLLQLPGADSALEDTAGPEALLSLAHRVLAALGPDRVQASTRSDVFTETAGKGHRHGHYAVCERTALRCSAEPAAKVVGWLHRGEVVEVIDSQGKFLLHVKLCLDEEEGGDSAELSGWVSAVSRAGMRVLRRRTASPSPRASSPWLRGSGSSSLGGANVFETALRESQSSKGG